MVCFSAAGLRTGSRLLIANDPDADRLAVAEESPSPPGGHYLTFSGNEIGILLADWLWRNHKRLNPRVSVSATRGIRSRQAGVYIYMNSRPAPIFLASLLHG